MQCYSPVLVTHNACCMCGVTMQVSVSWRACGVREMHSTRGLERSTAVAGTGHSDVNAKRIETEDNLELPTYTRLHFVICCVQPNT